MSKENKYKRQHEERANEHMRKAFERFTDADGFMNVPDEIDEELPFS